MSDVCKDLGVSLNEYSGTGELTSYFFWFSTDVWHYLTGWVLSVTLVSTENG